MFYDIEKIFAEKFFIFELFYHFLEENRTIIIVYSIWKLFQRIYSQNSQNYSNTIFSIVACLHVSISKCIKQWIRR